ncbi:heme ABC transporter ATP-binding protein [Cellulomonas triticagri]|uniref:Heme ABC transporter ATP-binding protein n=1 Tax=Cellulomonas triticagri TaxID=2483352 RepID=A0A3M2JIW4_9CELL|nr:heme ABC transporter ATP-binding protein [Cellulomonas triticagri]
MSPRALRALRARTRPAAECAEPAAHPGHPGPASPHAASAGAIVLRGVGFDVDGVTLLDGVDLDVEPGSLLAVVGPNGAGKSTLLGLLAGDLRPTRGTVTSAGTAIEDVPVADLARRRAVLLQEHRLSFPFSVAEVVRMGRSPWRGTAAEDDDDRHVTEAAAAADVLHLADRRFPTLSGGEKARTAYARARAQATPVLLLDEPTAALDIRHQEMVLAQARDLARAGHAVVAVLHDLSLAAAYADRVLLLGEGRARALGTPAEVLRADLLGEVYRHRVEVLTHPRTGDLIVLPDRTTPEDHR